MTEGVNTWLAYVTSEDESCGEVEPGVNAQRSLTWSQRKQSAECIWQGYDETTARSSSSSVSSSIAAESSSTTATPAVRDDSADSAEHRLHASVRTAIGPAAASWRLPHRISTRSQRGESEWNVQRSVYFVPTSFRSIPDAWPSVVCEVLEQHRRTSVAQLHAAFIKSCVPLGLALENDGETSASISASVAACLSYARFRLLWTLMRDGARPLSVDGGSVGGSTPENRLERKFHEHLAMVYAPVPAVDNKKATQRITNAIEEVMGMKGKPDPKSPLHAAVLRGGAGLLPLEPLACGTSNCDAMVEELLATALHVQTCLVMNIDVDAAQWSKEFGTSDGIPTDEWCTQWRAACDSARRSIEHWLCSFLGERLAFVNFVIRSYQQLLPVRTLISIVESHAPFEPLDYAFQTSLVSLLSPFPSSSQRLTSAQRFPPPPSYRLEFWRVLNSTLESQSNSDGLEVHDDIPCILAELLKNRCGDEQSQPSHWTGNYLQPTMSGSQTTDNVQQLQSVCLRVKTGFSTTTGLTLWPAGLVMCDFILSNPHLFRGKRILELGVGTGITSILLQRLGAECLVVTDGDPKVVGGLQENFCNNSIPMASEYDPDASIPSSYGPGVHVVLLPWDSDDRSSILAAARPDLILGCDIIPWPETHRALAEVTREAIQIGQRTKAGTQRSNDSVSQSSPLSSSDASIPIPVSSLASSLTFPCALFTQALRNPDTFTHYVDMFTSLGLNMSSVEWKDQLPMQMALDDVTERDHVQFQLIRLMDDEH